MGDRVRAQAHFEAENEEEKGRRIRMRQRFDPQSYLEFTGSSKLKVVRQYRERYEAISETIDKNAGILHLVDRDLQKLSQGGKRGRKGKYTSENILRALIVHELEGTALRQTVVRIAESDTLKNFVRLGNRDVMDYSFLDKCFKAIRHETWKAVNDALTNFSSGEELIDPSTIRTDTTVVEANIHYPTDASLLWDSYRVLVRLLRIARLIAPELVENRFHDRKVKKLWLFITRYAASKSKQRQRKVKKSFRNLIDHIGRLVSISENFCAVVSNSSDLELMGIGKEIESFLPAIRTVLDVVERVKMRGEKVPARERVFSIFEQHVELIMRGKRNKPVEFGHKIVLSETKEKFITDYDVLEKQVADSELTELVVNRHEELFGKAPDVLAGDCGFWSGEESMKGIREKVDTVAIPKNLRDLAANILPRWHRFRAGVEGTISVLKRAFRLMRCLYRGFKSFVSAVGLGIFCHNLVCLSRCSKE